jgi:hypothetical protein
MGQDAEEPGQSLHSIGSGCDSWGPRQRGAQAKKAGYGKTTPKRQSNRHNQVRSRTVHFFFSFGFSSSKTEDVGAALNMPLLRRLLPRSDA